ncbi:alpha/beta fold hydrolase [Thalassospira povalilytica]|uniref:Alpha/beta fold hydrolase n=1 Tax=Thalassospira povalilytica TaxID=732237 RepID=A0A8I1SHQ0_9PROT|nr:alpha/beta fold hydrolase [Thalassospira povalilytica]MBN8195144.1 alpha/beta fold hydrolase [Thalassospira povalilytica]
MPHDFRDIEREKFAINAKTCEWTIRAMTALRANIDINIKMHGPRDHLAQGDIFMFNHFARFETFIPQFLIALETGVYCRSIASGEFFVQDNTFSRYLRALGGVPNDYERLLPFLAEEILRGGKVVVFPEGGMVKDRRVLSEERPHPKRPDYSVYSRSADTRRAHHTGAALLGLCIDGFKIGLSTLIEKGKRDELSRWADILDCSEDALRTTIAKPTLMFPANITFHPLRVDQNLLARAADMFTGGLSPKMAEELIIEGNLMFKKTDMDIRLGDPVDPRMHFNWLDRRMLARRVAQAGAIDDLFKPARTLEKVTDRVTQYALTRHIKPLRDHCMAVMYSNLTLNVSHLASRLIMMWLEDGVTEIDIGHFDRTLYLAIKNIQQAENVHLHRGMKNPADYVGIFELNCPQIRFFIDSAVQLGLIERRDQKYCFLPKLQDQAHFDQIRMDNPIMVYANEMAPIHAAWQALERARVEVDHLSPVDIAHRRFDDEVRAWSWNRAKFKDPKYDAINQQETATADSRPYLLLPNGQTRFACGVLLVHGFLASPAELRELGDKLSALGYAVMGVRLSGHGTSPHELQKRTWSDWLASVRRGYEILSPFCEQVIIVGFSTGGALSAIHAANHPEKLAGLVLASTPLKFRNRNLMFVPLLYGANKLMGWMPSAQELLSFRPNDSEHPDINYRNIPIGGLHQLRQAVAEMQRRLPDLECPTLVLQGDGDQVVDPASASMIRRLAAKATEIDVQMVTSGRHGIVTEDIDNTQNRIIDFITDHCAIRDDEARAIPAE